MNINSLDIFCHVIDNFGDIGVVYRFARELKRAHASWRIRVFLDDLAAFALLDPRVDCAKTAQYIDEVNYIDWHALTADTIPSFGVAEVLVEAFGCQIPEVYEQQALFKSALWINLEYLSAESWTGGYHLKESLQRSGTVRKYFYMPGFTKNTGGVIIDRSVGREKELLRAHRIEIISQILERAGVSFNVADRCFGTVFSYERRFDALLHACRDLEKPCALLVFGEKSSSGMLSTLTDLKFTRRGKNHFLQGTVDIIIHPFLPQIDYDRLLCCTDFNIVRGEDSLVRAILAGVPFVWNAYIQEEGYQRVKVHALLEIMHPYFSDPAVFTIYQQLMTEFNRTPGNAVAHSPQEDFAPFFRHQHEIAHAISEMSYFLELNGDLIKNLSSFLSEFSNENRGRASGRQLCKDE
jgi:uncharacterized repeat protein (TIGR03837 family)